MADARENLQRRESRSMEETQGRTVYGRLERRCEGDLRSRENEDSVSRTSEAGQIRHHRRENLQRNLPTNQNDRGRRSEMAQSSAYPVRPRKGDCWNYVKTGQCRYGSNCIYNHTPGPMRQDFIVPGYVHSQGITNPDSRYPALRERFRENQREDIERQMRELIMQDNQFDSRDRDSDWSFEHTQFEKEPENTQPQGYMPPPSMPMMSQLPRPTQMPPQGHMPPPSMPMMSQLPRPMQMPPQGHMPPPSMPMMSHQMPGSVGMQGAMYPPVLPSYFMNPQGLPSGGGPQMCYPQGLGGFNSPQMVPPGFNNPYQQQPQPPLPPGPPPPNNNNQSHQ